MNDNLTQIGVITTYGRIVLTDAGWTPDMGDESINHFKRLAGAHEGLDESRADTVATFCGGDGRRHGRWPGRPCAPKEAWRIQYWQPVTTTVTWRGSSLTWSIRWRPRHEPQHPLSSP